MYQNTNKRDKTKDKRAASAVRSSKMSIGSQADPEELDRENSSMKYLNIKQFEQNWEAEFPDLAMQTKEMAERLQIHRAYKTMSKSDSKDSDGAASPSWRVRISSDDAMMQNQGEPEKPNSTLRGHGKSSFMLLTRRSPSGNTDMLSDEDLENLKQKANDQTKFNDFMKDL